MHLKATIKLALSSAHQQASHFSWKLPLQVNPHSLEIHYECTNRCLPPRLTLFTTVPNLHFCIFFQFSIQTLLVFACISNEFVEAGISLPSINKLCKYSANKSKKKAEKSKAITFLRSLCSGNFLKDLFLASSYGDVAERKGKGSQPTVVTFLPLLSTRRTALQRREREAARSCTQNKRQAKFYR